MTRPTDALRAAADALETRQRSRRGGGEAPEERGERLATVPRRDGAELRITWDEYKGSPYMGLREWTKDRSGGPSMFPTKTGITVRRGELPALARAVADAIDRAVAHEEKHPKTARWGKADGGS